MTGRSKIREGRDTLAVMNLVEVLGTLGASAKKMMIIGAHTIMTSRAVTTSEEHPTALGPTGRTPSAGNTGSPRKTRAMTSITIRCLMETRQPTTSPATVTVTVHLDSANPSRTPLRENLPVTVATRRTWSTTATTRANLPSQKIGARPLVEKSKSLGSPSQAATTRHTLSGAKIKFPEENRGAIIQMGRGNPLVRNPARPWAVRETK